MDRELLLKQIKQAVLELKPDAEVILYGSRSRGDEDAESDWDILVLVDGPVDDVRTDAICHRLYEIEWKTNEVLCALVRNRREWSSPLYQAMPFHRNVEREGLRL